MNEACRRTVTVEVPAEIVGKETDRRVQQYRKMARIPGFRQGKVPESIIRRRFLGDIRGEVLEQLVPQYFREQVEKEKLVPVSQPHITEMSNEQGQPLKFTAAFEVMPEFSVAGYKGLRAEKKDTSVSEQEVEEALKELQQRQATFEAVEDRALVEGDFAQISFTGTATAAEALAKGDSDDKAAGQTRAEGNPADVKPVEVKDVMIEIGGANTVKEFTENLRGAAPGEERSFEVKYADDFADERLAGQSLRYAVKIHGVKKKVAPDLNDEFAKELGEFATIDALRARIRENMEAQKKHDIEHKAKEELVEQLVNGNDFPVPQSMIERQVDTRLERGLRALAQQGMRQDQMKKLNFERLREGQREAATREVKASLLLEKVADLENIQVHDEELQAELESYAAQMGQPLAALRAQLERDGTIERLRDRIRNEKALDFLYNHAS